MSVPLPPASCGSSAVLTLRQGPRGQADDALARRWQRAADLGADPEGQHWARHGVVSATRRAEAAERTEDIWRGAANLLEGFGRLCGDADHVAVLSDSEGVVSRVLGGGRFAADAKRLRLVEGAYWGEELRGTNAIGTALAERGAVVVDGAAHFASVNKELGCIAAPIHGPGGDIVGILDATCMRQRLGALAPAVLLDVVRAIEDVLRIRAHGAVDRSSEMALIERLLDRSSVPAYLVERPPLGQRMGRVVRRNRAARVFEHARGRAAGLPPFNVLMGLARGDEGSAQGASIEVELIADDSGTPIAALAFLHDGAPPRRIQADPVATRRRPLRGTRSAFNGLLGDDPAFAAAITMAKRLAPSTLPVLLLAETGTGKDLFARAIHRASPRSSAPFQALNCGALHGDLLLAEFFGHAPGAYTGAASGGRDGILHSAHGGTLFLDEVADLPPAGQVALLRVLETGTFQRLGETETCHVDVRVVAATSADLAAMVEAGTFRQDLYYRLAGAAIRIPPLRERGDLRPLIEALWQRTPEAGGGRLAAATVEALAAHPWPGNVRELKSALRCAAVMAGPGAEVLPEHLPPSLLGADARPAAIPAPESGMDAARQRAVREALEASGGNVSAAARELGVARSTIYRMQRRWAAAEQG